MELLPQDDRGRYRGLPTGDEDGWMASAEERTLETDELDVNLAMANSGDPEALEKLREYFGARNSPGVFRRLLFRAMAKGGLGAGSLWDHWNAQAEFERIEDGLRLPDATFAEKLLAEAAAFAYVHSNLAHSRAYDIQFEARGGVSDRAHRDQCANAAKAHLTFLRAMREIDHARMRRARVEEAERRRVEAIPEEEYVDTLRQRVAQHDQAPPPSSPEFEQIHVQS